MIPPSRCCSEWPPSGARRAVATEKDLVAALKRGERDAFEQLLAQHGAMMFRVAVRLLGQRAEAEDVLQEAWMSVFEKIGTFQEHAALTTWLYRIVVNAALMRVRQRGLAAETLLDPPGPPLTEGGYHARTVADWTASPEDALLRQEALTLLRQAVDRLPSGYRAVYVLAEIEGLPHQEIAHLLEVSVGAVTVRLHRARLGLREALSEYFEGRQQWPAGTPGAEETIS